MGKTGGILSYKTEQYLETMGHQIMLARKRRKLSAKLVAQRAGISRVTLSKVENGNPSVTIGTYATVLHALNGLDEDMLKIAKDDRLGRELQDIEMDNNLRQK